MKFRLLERARMFLAAAAFVALALGVGIPAWAAAPVTEEQADAPGMAADDFLQGNAGRFVAQTTATFDWSAPGDRAAWFPTLDQDDLTLLPSPVQRVDLSAVGVAASEPVQPSTLITNEHAVIPLPPAAWTGLVGLASLAAIHGRKAIVRFFS